MDGIEGAITTVVDRLKAALPAKTVQLRERYGIDPTTQGHLLPDVVTVDRYNRAQLALEEWPAVLVAGLNTPSMRRADVGGGLSKWLVRYDLRAFVWIRADDQVTVELVRGRLTLALRELLLARRTMTGSLMVDDTTLAESYSELMDDDENQGTIGAAYIAFSVWVEESLDDEIAGYGDVAEQPRLDTATLPPHPAL